MCLSMGCLVYLVSLRVCDHTTLVPRHCPLTSVNPQPAGAHNCLGSFLHSVRGETLLTTILETLHTSLGTGEHLVLVV